MSRVSTIKAAVFDVEGTLVDCRTLLLESWRETLQEVGHSLTHRELQPYFGMDGEWMLDQLLPEASKADRDQLVKAQGERYRRDFLRSARAFPGVRDLMEALKDTGILVGIATTCQQEELALYDQQMRVLPLADAVICGEAVKHGKPSPALLQRCLQTLGSKEPAAVIAVGDTPYDAIGAKQIGMRPVGVLTGGFSAPELRDAGCEHVFAQVSAVRELWSGAPRRARAGRVLTSEGS